MSQWRFLETIGFSVKSASAGWMVAVCSFSACLDERLRVLFVLLLFSCMQEQHGPNVHVFFCFHAPGMKTVCAHVVTMLTGNFKRSCFQRLFTCKLDSPWPSRTSTSDPEPPGRMMPFKSHIMSTCDQMKEQNQRCENPVRLIYILRYFRPHFE